MDCLIDFLFKEDLVGCREQVGSLVFSASVVMSYRVYFLNPVCGKDFVLLIDLSCVSVYYLFLCSLIVNVTLNFGSCRFQLRETESLIGFYQDSDFHSAVRLSIGSFSCSIRDKENLVSRIYRL